MTKRIHQFLALSLALALYGCETSTIKSAGFYYGGYKATASAIDSDPANADTARFAADAIDAILVADSIVFSAIEEWYAVERLKLGLDPIDREMLEMLVIRPLWEELKSKYKGHSLSVDNPEVRQRLVEFQAGMRAALAR